MANFNITTSDYKIDRPCIWAKFDKETDYAYYKGTYAHPLAEVNINGCDWPKNKYCNADFVYAGRRFSLHADTYLTPKSWCYHVKKWLEEMIESMP